MARDSHAETVSRRLALITSPVDHVEDHAAPASPDPRGGWSVDGPTRIHRAPTDAVAVSEGPPALPIPGRHAVPRQKTLGALLGPPLGPTSRRLVDSLVPDSLKGRVSLGAPQVAVLSLIVAAALAWLAYGVLAAESRPLDPPNPMSSVSPGDLPALATPAAAADVGSAGGVATDVAAPAGGEEQVTVHVAGKVRRPGIAVLPKGARVVDALEAAGGARRGVELTALNLARVLVDGEQILVGVPPVATAGGAAGSATAGASGPLVNINTADQATLESLPGVGPVTATAILDWRTQHGAFSSVEELLEVKGIGEATLAQISPHATL